MRELIITRGGRELAARLISGESTAEFTRLAASDHDYSGVELSELAELSDIRQDVLFSGVKRVDGTVVELMAAMDNRSLTAGYYVRAIGVFARETGGGEVLFAVAVEPELPFYMPPFSGKTVSSVTYRLNVKVSNSDNVVLDANPAAYVTVEQLGEVQKLAEGHLSAEVSDADGVHGVRYLNGEFRVLDGGNWVGIDAITVGGAAVMTTTALGLHQMASGTAAANASNCPVGCWYGQYE